MFRRIKEAPIKEMQKYMIILYLCLGILGLLSGKYDYIVFSSIIVIQGIIGIIRPSLVLEMINENEIEKKKRGLPTLSNYIDINMLPFISSKLSGYFLIIVGIIIFLYLRHY